MITDNLNLSRLRGAYGESLFLGVFVWFLVLSGVSWAYIIFGVDSGLGDLFTGRSWSNAGHFFSQLLGLEGGLTGGGRPAFFDLGRWGETGKLAYKTLMMSVLAIGWPDLGCW
ncbi:MAG: hypothetical protein CM1200mP22_07560 [Dehalococcoidia bacterium]|nr:MAG: hypothetical protein CM1200mP22_07560 [Dehalococcoidia bacterium]